jgi:hypothetical protein
MSLGVCPDDTNSVNIPQGLNEANPREVGGDMLRFLEELGVAAIQGWGKESWIGFVALGGKAPDCGRGPEGSFLDTLEGFLPLSVVGDLLLGTSLASHG